MMDCRDFSNHLPNFLDEFLYYKECVSWSILECVEAAAKTLCVEAKQDALRDVDSEAL